MNEGIKRVVFIIKDHLVMIPDSVKVLEGSWVSLHLSSIMKRSA